MASPIRPNEKIHPSSSEELSKNTDSSQNVSAAASDSFIGLSQMAPASASVRRVSQGEKGHESGRIKLLSSS